MSQMNKKKERIATIAERIESLQNEKKELEKKLKDEEQKARTHRLCQRGGLLESLVPQSISLTDERFKIFLVRTITTDFARQILEKLILENEQESIATSE